MLLDANGNAIKNEEQDFVAVTHQINHDLSTLYTICRAVLPRDILGAILYAEFVEPSFQDIANAKSLIESNRLRINQQPDGLWHESEDDVRPTSSDNL